MLFRVQARIASCKPPPKLTWFLRKSAKGKKCCCQKIPYTYYIFYVSDKKNEAHKRQMNGLIRREHSTTTNERFHRFFYCPYRLLFYQGQVIQGHNSWQAYNLTASVQGRCSTYCSSYPRYFHEGPSGFHLLC